MTYSQIDKVIYLAAMVAAFMAMALTLFMMIYLRDRSRSRYDDEKQRAILSGMRASFEGQIARLNHQLMATEGRWRETNHLILSSQSHQADAVDGAPVLAADDFVRSLGINPSDIELDERLVFLLTPFADDEREVYATIAEVCRRNGFICVRGDEEHITGEILPHIVRLMLSARIIVANITSRNANVFYELGIAHAIGKKTILIAKTFSEVPFDVQSKRVVFYHNEDELKSGFTDAMLQAFRQKI